MIAQSLSLVKAERSQGRVKLQIWAKRRILSVLLQEILRFSLGILHRIPEAVKTEAGGQETISRAFPVFGQPLLHFFCPLNWIRKESILVYIKYIVKNVYKELFTLSTGFSTMLFP